MTTYHLERRPPRNGETYILEVITSGTLDPGMVATAVCDFPAASRYVITEDRPKSDHPEALLIRVNGELYGRTRNPETNGFVYMSVNNDRDFQVAAYIDEWEDVYDEVPEPEPEHPTSDIILIKAIANDAGLVSLPVYALRRSTDDMYTTPNFASIRPVDITAWEDIDTNGDSK